MKRTKIGALVLTALLAWMMSGCPKATDSCPIPPEGTRATSNSDAFKRAAKDLEKDLARSGPACYMDGIQTSCVFVLACLRSGSCVLATKDTP